MRKSAPDRHHTCTSLSLFRRSTVVCLVTILHYYLRTACLVFGTVWHLWCWCAVTYVTRSPCCSVVWPLSCRCSVTYVSPFSCCRPDMARQGGGHEVHDDGRQHRSARRHWPRRDSLYVAHCGTCIPTLQSTYDLQFISESIDLF